MRPPSRPTRREVVVTASTLVVGLGLNGCTWPGGASDQDTGSTPSAPDDPDEISLERVSEQMHAALDLVSGTATTHPALSARLSSIAACHTAHLEVLGVDGTTSGAPDGSVPPTPSRALKKLSATEEQLVALLTTEAGGVESGTLARVYAVMAAGLGPFVAALPQPTPFAEEGVEP